MIDLQVKQWFHLCRSDCEDCNMKSKEFKDAVKRGVEKISIFLPTQKKANPMWNKPAGAHPHAKASTEARVKEEVKEEEPPQKSRKTAEIRLANRAADRAKPAKVKVDEREAQEAYVKQTKDKLGRRKEQFAEGRQSSGADSKRREKLAEHFPKAKARGDAYVDYDYRAEHPHFYPASTNPTASSSTAPAPGPRPPSGPPPKIVRAKENPAQPQSPPKVPASTTSKAAGTVPASAASSDVEAVGDSFEKIAQDICSRYTEDDVASVLASALKVFMPEMTVWNAIQCFETPQKVIEFLMGDKEMQPKHFTDMFNAIVKERPTKRTMIETRKPDPKWPSEVPRRQLPRPMIPPVPYRSCLKEKIKLVFL